MASYILFESLNRLAVSKPFLTRDEKLWLIDSINNRMDLNGKEKLYSLMVVFYKFKDSRDSQDSREPYYDIEQLHPRLQVVWYIFTQMHLKKNTRI